MSKITSAENLPLHPILVIGRQFGSGARETGRKVAERLGMAYYDKMLLSESAGRLGFDPSIFAAADEKRPSPLRALLQGSYGIADNFNSDSLSGERLYATQSQVIRELCLKGPCVVVGRTADHVLRDFPWVTSVFLHAPMKHRVDKILKRCDAATPSQAADIARRRDRERENYYNYYTGRKWGRADNYHFSIDSSSMSQDDLIELICACVQARRPESSKK